MAISLEAEASASSASSPISPPSYLPALATALHDQAQASVQEQKVTDLTPLKAFISLSKTHPEHLSIPLALDAALAFPTSVKALTPAFTQLLSRRSEITSFLNTLTCSAATLRPTARLLHALLRLPWAPLIQERRESIIQALSKDYKGGEIAAKAEVLSLVHALGGVQVERGGAPFQNRSLAQDYAIFSGAKVGQDELALLRSLHDEEASDDPRVAAVLALFPLPRHLVIEAFGHELFASGSESKLVDAILGGGVPAELGELRRAVAALNGEEVVDEGLGADGVGVGSGSGSGSGTKDVPVEASRTRGAWSADDLAKIHKEDKVTEIPDGLRASILRLVEAQKEEEEAAARALAEAHGVAPRTRETREAGDDEDDEEIRMPRMPAADGEESGEEEVEGTGFKTDSTQTLLELAYLRTPGVFARDSATRRSAERKALREATEMDDSQIEGWKVMLERNPHKDAILERHQFSVERAAVPKREPKERKEGSREFMDEGEGGGGGPSRGGHNHRRSGGRGGGGGGQGGGGGGGGQGGGQGGGGGRGRGGGGGRGRANKSSRGHQNAQRTRGADRKAARMGAGL